MGEVKGFTLFRAFHEVCYGRWIIRWSFTFDNNPNTNPDNDEVKTMYVKSVTVSKRDRSQIYREEGPDDTTMRTLCVDRKRGVEVPKVVQTRS